MTQSTRDWLPIATAAAALGISERTVRRWCESGKIAGQLTSTETGKTWLVSAADVSVRAARSADIAAASSGHGAVSFHPPPYLSADNQSGLKGSESTEIIDHSLYFQSPLDSSLTADDMTARADRPLPEVRTASGDTDAAADNLRSSISSDIEGTDNRPQSADNDRTSADTRADIVRPGDIEPLRRDIEQIKAFMAGDMAAQFRAALAEIPNRDDLRGAVNDALAGVEKRVGESLESIAARLDQLGAQPAHLSPDAIQNMVEEAAQRAAESARAEAPTSADLAAIQGQLAQLAEQQQAQHAADAAKIEELEKQLTEAKAQAERRAAITPPPAMTAKPWWKIW